MQILFWIVGNATLIRILDGDLIWFVLGGIGALMGWQAASPLNNKYARVIVGLILAAGGLLAFHFYYEAFMTWYTTPLGTPLQGIP